MTAHFCDLVEEDLENFYQSKFKCISQEESPISTPVDVIVMKFNDMCKQILDEYTLTTRMTFKSAIRPLRPEKQAWSRVNHQYRRPVRGKATVDWCGKVYSARDDTEETLITINTLSGKSCRHFASHLCHLRNTSVSLKIRYDVSDL